MDTRLPADMESVVAQLAGVLGVPPEDLAADDDLFIAGLDSVRPVMLIDRWAALGLDLDPAQLLDDPTPRGFWKVMKHTGA